jgi:RHH-type proline utilization regulon transcriptional repressor/proline dehydrogenase/delta 1-pyrroline-5-carboxylate dehydrogenase
MNEQARKWIFSAPERDIPLAVETISAEYLADETMTVRGLVELAKLEVRESAQIVDRARDLVTRVRARSREHGGLDAFMSEYDLSSQEGVALMCLAESLLRIPDAETADRLIADKLGAADFGRHLGDSESLFVNAATWGLMLTGRVLRQDKLHHRRLADTFDSALARLGEPVIRAALRQAMRILGHQFVVGRTIGEALERSRRGENRIYRYSFDMLGEAALTRADARRYLDAYAEAIATLGRRGDARRGAEHEASRKEWPSEDLRAAPSISVKLSALHPRFEFAQSSRALSALGERLGTLAGLARRARIGLTIDAEEVDRLELTLAVFRALLERPEAADWPGLGLAVQAYQKRALPVIEWLEAEAARAGRTIPVRLVKGAYWDTEIKRAQEQGLSGYPVFTRKSSTDVAYMACARTLLERCPHLYPQFATHNAHAVAWIEHVGRGRDFEFQRLHGMGEALYAELVGAGRDGGPDEGSRSAAPAPRPCRVYAPVGSHEDLLPYLVRRLLENGANTSFVNRIVDEDASIDEIVQDPVARTLAFGTDLPHPRIPLPADLYGAERRNSAGINLADPIELEALATRMAASANGQRRAAPIVGGRIAAGKPFESRDPADWRRVVGEVDLADADTARRALECAAAFFPRWNAEPAASRAAVLDKASNLLEEHRGELAALCVAEGGRSVADSLSEVREAVDFLRYYARECKRSFAAPIQLPGPTGQRDLLRLTGRGVFLCISPWNFPIAIFTGQVAAALAAGNTVLAKPAEQTSLIAARVVELLFEAGIPDAALGFLPGKGFLMGEALLGDARLAGVAFTGSLETAKIIEGALAAREGAIATLIAETGGVNAMIVDSSALAEQVVRDVVQSAFDSAGQRCSALRLLCLQDDTADHVLEMLEGQMAELVIGPPSLLASDVGPVIDPAARQALLDYLDSVRDTIRYQCELPQEHASGIYMQPTLVEVDHPADLPGEVFGPILHVLRYRASEIDALVDAINAQGYGLTLGIHSRIEDFAERIAARARAGNVYVNRNMIGAVVGVQPFGGMGLSGTGPKAGGPHYLGRFATEQSVSINTAAVGGNATLLSLGEQER